MLAVIKNKKVWHVWAFSNRCMDCIWSVLHVSDMVSQIQLGSGGLGIASLVKLCRVQTHTLGGQTHRFNSLSHRPDAHKASSTQRVLCATFYVCSSIKQILFFLFFFFYHFSSFSYTNRSVYQCGIMFTR